MCRFASITVAVACALAACGGGDASGEDAGAALDAASDAGPRGSAALGPADRPARLILPFEHDSPMPLVVLLHGYSVSALVQDAYFRTTPRARERGFALLLPDGTVDAEGNRFWNALPGFMGLPETVDDVAYLLALVDEVLERFDVDRERVYLLGHSNGAFMSYRLACEHADRFRALASLAGSSSDDAGWCTPAGPVSVLQIHGDADDIVLYEGEAGAYASAREMTDRWAGHAGCDASPVAGEPVDFDGELPEQETEVLSYPGCDAGTAVELWTIRGGGHLPAVSDEGIDTTLDWLLAR